MNSLSFWLGFGNGFFPGGPSFCSIGGSVSFSSLAISLCLAVVRGSVLELFPWSGEPLRGGCVPGTLGVLGGGLVQVDSWLMFPCCGFPFPACLGSGEKMICFLTLGNSPLGVKSGYARILEVPFLVGGLVPPFGVVSFFGEDSGLVSVLR